MIIRSSARRAQLKRRARLADPGVAIAVLWIVVVLVLAFLMLNVGVSGKVVLQ